MLILEALIIPIMKLQVRLWMDENYRKNPKVLELFHKEQQQEEEASKKEEMRRRSRKERTNSGYSTSSRARNSSLPIPPAQMNENSVRTSSLTRSRGKSLGNQLFALSTSSARGRVSSINDANMNDVEMKHLSTSSSSSNLPEKSTTNLNNAEESNENTREEQEEQDRRSTFVLYDWPFAHPFRYYLWTSWFPAPHTTTVTKPSESHQNPYLLQQQLHPPSSHPPSQQPPRQHHPHRPQHIPVLFDKDRYVVRLNSYLLILVVYGTIFPPLALLACFAIYSHTFFTTIHLGRLLSVSTTLVRSNTTEAVPAASSTSSPLSSSLEEGSSVGYLPRFQKTLSTVLVTPTKFIQTSLKYSSERLSLLTTLKNPIFHPFQWYESQLMKDCQGLMIPLKYTLIVLLLISMFLFSFLLFDIFGRTVDPRKASIPAFIFAGYTAVLVYFSFRLYYYRPSTTHQGGGAGDKQQKRLGSLPPAETSPSLTTSISSKASRKMTKDNPPVVVTMQADENPLHEKKNDDVDQNNDEGEMFDDEQYDGNDDDYDVDDDDSSNEEEDDDEADLAVRTFEFRFSGFWSVSGANSFSSNRAPSLINPGTTREGDERSPSVGTRNPLQRSAQEEP